MIHVLVIDDVRAVRDMSITALRSEQDLEVRGQATQVEQLKSQLAWCDLVVINAGAEGDNSLQLISAIHKYSNRTKIVVIGLIGTHSFLLRCLEAGINGYLLQDSSLSDLLRTIRAVYGDQGLIASPRPEAPSAFLNEQPEAYSAAVPQNRLSLLTRREREVLNLMQHGQTNKEIAEILVVELGTVKNHVHSILHKLNINSRRETLYLPQTGGLWRWPEPAQALAKPETYGFTNPKRFAALSETTSGN